MNKRSAKYAGLSAEALARIAIDSSRDFKIIGSRLEAMRPSREAAQILVKGFTTKQVKGWLAAYLLGCIRHSEGYDVVKYILHAGLGQLSESYAGVALVKIAGAYAFDDLRTALWESSSRRTREGAAYGLGELGSPEAREVLLRATFARRIPILKGGRILGDKFEFPDHMIVKLFSGNPDATRLATEILWGRIGRSSKNENAKPNAAVVACLRELLLNKDFKMRPCKRRALKTWLETVGAADMKL